MRNLVQNILAKKVSSLLKVWSFNVIGVVFFKIGLLSETYFHFQHYRNNYL